VFRLTDGIPLGLVGDLVWILFIWPRSGWMGSKVRLYFNKEPWCPLELQV